MKHATFLAIFLGSLARARSGSAATTEIPSAFFISKTENKNQVHYAVLVDESCKPVGASPVRPYWKNLERGPNDVSALLSREQAAYGIASQSVKDGLVALTLRALPTRPVRIQTGRSADGTCQAWTRLLISGEEAQLFNIHVVLGVLRVSAIILTGWAWTDRRVLRETITR